MCAILLNTHDIWEARRIGCGQCRDEKRNWLGAERRRLPAVLELPTTVDAVGGGGPRPARTGMPPLTAPLGLAERKTLQHHPQNDGF